MLLERERLHQLQLHALEAAAEHALGQGRYGHAIDTALAAIQADPLRESAHRVLIRAHVAEGNREVAMRQCHEYCRLAREHLELGPSQQLRELVAALTG